MALPRFYNPPPCPTEAGMSYAQFNLLSQMYKCPMDKLSTDQLQQMRSDYLSMLSSGILEAEPQADIGDAMAAMTKRVIVYIDMLLEYRRVPLRQASGEFKINSRDEMLALSMVYGGRGDEVSFLNCMMAWVALGHPDKFDVDMDHFPGLPPISRAELTKQLAEMKSQGGWPLEG